MGNICNGAHDREDMKETNQSLSKNINVCEFTLRNNCAIELILGTCRHHKGLLLLSILQQQNLEFSTELREYSQNYSTVIDAVANTRKRLLEVNASRNCPYKKFFLCVLPSYNTQDRESYLQQFQRMMQQIVQFSNDITIQINFTFESTNGIPNQTLLSVFFRKVLLKLKRPVKIWVISNEQKLLQMTRFEVVKLGDVKLKNFLKEKESL